MKNMFNVRMDCREHAPVLHQALRDMGFGVTVEQLKIGDFQLDPDITIERKTVSDFCLSLVDGRLFRQAYLLVSGCENPLVIIEGGNFSDSNVKVGQAALKGALITLALTFRLPVLRSRNEQDTAWHFKQLALQRHRVGVNRGPLTSCRPKALAARKRRLFRTLPGVGSHLAEVLIQEFGSITKLCSASEQELLAVHGVGKKTARRIFEALKEAPAEYVI